VAAGLESELRAVIVVNGPERADHGDVVGALADAGEPVADEQAGLAVGAIAGLQRHDGFAIAVGGIGADDVGVDALGIEDIFVRRVRD
jgi:hypothetical protein